jgi:hypothetical protein
MLSYLRPSLLAICTSQPRTAEEREEIIKYMNTINADPNDVDLARLSSAVTHIRVVAPYTSCELARTDRNDFIHNKISLPMFSLITFQFEPELDPTIVFILHEPELQKKTLIYRRFNIKYNSNSSLLSNNQQYIEVDPSNHETIDSTCSCAVPPTIQISQDIIRTNTSIFQSM